MISFLVNIFTCIFESAVSLMFINSWLGKKADRSNFTFILSVGILSLAIILSNLYASAQLINVAAIILSVFCVSSFYTRQPKGCMLLSALVILVMFIAEVIVLFAMSAIGHVTAQKVIDDEYYNMFGSIMSKLLSFIMLKFIGMRFSTGKIKGVKNADYFLILTIFSVSTLVIYLMFIYQYRSPDTSTYNNLAVWCSIGLLYITLITISFYERISLHAETERIRDIEQQEMMARQKQLNALLVGQNELRTIAHDIKNHNIFIKSYFEEGDCEAGLKYMDKLLDLPIFDVDYLDSGNPPLDTLIRTKQTMAMERHIDFEVDIRIPENIFVDAFDLCTIFGNALDNSIEACMQLPIGRKKYIRLSLVYNDLSLMCKIINSTNKVNNNFLETTKSDKENHGLGVQSIKSALANYENICNFEQNEDEFILSFVIFKSK